MLSNVCYRTLVCKRCGHTERREIRFPDEPGRMYELEECIVCEVERGLSSGKSLRRIVANRNRRILRRKMRNYYNS